MHVADVVNMLQMLWICCRDRNFSISTTNSQLLEHCRGIVVILLWSDFQIKLPLGDNKDTTFTTSSQHVYSHIETRLFPKTRDILFLIYLASKLKKLMFRGLTILRGEINLVNFSG